MTTFLKATALTAAILAAIAGHAHAGGAVIIEDTAEAAPAPKKDDKTVLAIIVGVALIALIAGHGGRVCQNDTPAPTDGGC